VEASPRRRRRSLRGHRRGLPSRAAPRRDSSRLPCPVTVERWLGREVVLLQHADEEAARYAAARERGDYDIAAVIAGEAVDLIHDTLPAAVIIDRVVSEATRLLGAPGASIAGDVPT
jgi:hypothetical protein